jgi:hypothetical protein
MDTQLGLQAIRMMPIKSYGTLKVNWMVFVVLSLGCLYGENDTEKPPNPGN